jgi:pilus assembly protein CpaB
MTNMKKRIILVAAAVFLAVMGTFAVYSYGKSADKRALASTESSTVLVVTKRIPAGTTWGDALKGDYFSQQNYPAKTVPSTALADAKTAAIGKDAVALADISPGQFVLREAFGTKTAQTGALAIPKGYLAISVTLPANAEVAGYIGPNSDVTIFATAKYGTLANNNAAAGGIDVTKDEVFGDEVDATKTVVTQASVLAVSQAPVTEVDGSDSTGSSGAGSPLITLALTQRDAERVILSQKVGDLYLALLSPDSTVSGNDPGVNNVMHAAPVKLFDK